MYIPPATQNLLSLGLAAIWATGTITLYFRMRAKQAAYLRRFPPVEGVPLDMAVSGNPFGAVARAQWKAMLAHQTDSELERLRKEIWRRFLYQSLWIFGFPLLTIGMTALLIATGAITVMAK